MGRKINVPPGMPKNTAKQFIGFLTLSLRQIEKYDNIVRTDTESDYELSTGEEAEKHLEYHYFAYSQIAFALREYLLKSYPVQKEIILDFFNHTSSPTKDIISLGKTWKHDPFGWMYTVASYVPKKGILRSTSIKRVDTYTHSPALQSMQTKKKMRDIFRESLKKTKTFVKLNKFQ